MQMLHVLPRHVLAKLAAETAQHIPVAECGGVRGCRVELVLPIKTVDTMPDMLGSVVVQSAEPLQ